MGDTEITAVRSPEPLTITILRARNLKGQRGENVNTTVKVEFGEKPIGESPKVECTADAPAELNYNTTITVTFDDPHALEEIASKPVLCTVIEVLPKEKKQKEEKTVTLGQVTIDLMPLLQGETSKNFTLGINSVPGSPLDSIPADSPKPELDVMISVNEPLLSEEQLKEANLINITMESLFSTPDAWSVGGPQFNYTAAMPLPVSATKENTLVFAGGYLKPGVDKDMVNKQKRWAVPGNAVGSATYIPNQMISGESIEEEDGDFKGKEDREHRQTSEQDKNRVTWNIERRNFMDLGACKNMQEKIAKTRYWPVEVLRTPQATGGKGAKTKEDDTHPSFHGVVYLNLAPLLYPGVKKIRGAYKVHPFSEHDLHEKCDRKGSLAEEAVKIANGILHRAGGSPFPKGGKAKEDAKKEVKKGPSGNKASDSTSESTPEVVNVEGQQYLEAKSYMMIEICLHRPLVPKRPPEELARRVAEYIPPRPMFPKRTDGAQRAVADYHNQIGVVANLVLEEFRDKFGEQYLKGELKNSPNDMEARRQELVYHLNSSGKYFAFKEQLKHAVVKIVREKYLRTTTFKDKDALQQFLSELYVYLLDEMHVGLKDVLQIEDQRPIPEPLTDSAQLKHFAREAEVNGNFELATKYYQERIARDKNDPDHWLDFGTFCLYINDLTKAEECFKECVSIDQRHLHGLVLYGVVSTMLDKHDQAETFFEAATSFEPKSILAWTMLGLYYDGIGNEIGAEMALIEANKLNAHEAAAAARVQMMLKEDEIKEQQQQQLSAAQKDSIEVKEDTSMHIEDQASKPKTAENSPRPTSHRNKTLSPQEKPQDLSLTHDPLGEKELVLPGPRVSIYRQIIDFLLEVKATTFTERALAHHLLDSLGGQSAEYFIALARVNLQKQQMEEAEIALREALQFDHQNPDAWAILGHVRYMLGDTEFARDCYERTLDFVADASEMHSIYLRLASIYLQEAKFESAKNTFLRACKNSPSCVSWLGVGIACYRLGEVLEAEDALAEANILNNTDPEVWAYLALVCLQTGRQLEAEQAYKYAIKLHLQDENLMNELHEVQKEVGFGNPEF